MDPGGVHMPMELRPFKAVVDVGACSQLPACAVLGYTLCALLMNA